MKNIIIFYQVINREYQACLNLQKILKEEFNIESYIFSIDFENDKAIKLAKKIKIDMIIMPWIYQEMNYSLVVPFIKLNNDVVIVNLHHEQIASEASLNRMLPDGEKPKNSVVHFVWGEYFKNALIDSGVKENLIFVTGNLRSDKIELPKYSKEDLSRKFNLSMNKRWILFSENRGWVLTNTEKKDQDLIVSGYSEKDVEDHKQIALDSLNATIEQFENLPDSFFKDNELIYRPHPGTIAPPFHNENLKVISDYPIQQWLSFIDVNLVWSSTTIFESDMNEVPSFVYEPIPNFKKHKTFGLEYYQHIKSPLEISKDLINEYHIRIKPKRIYEKYIGPSDGKSTFRVAKAINEILSNKITGYKAQPDNSYKKHFYRTMLFQKVTRLFVKLNILDYVKFPKSAYELRDQIPYYKNNIE